MPKLTRDEVNKLMDDAARMSPPSTGRAPRPKPKLAPARVCPPKGRKK